MKLRLISVILIAINLTLMRCETTAEREKHGHAGLQLNDAKL